ncbi:MAG TPA: hypothetical protein VGG20_16850 [Thermoanaerobaculia bacterium]|jgi:hypothetical protein
MNDERLRRRLLAGDPGGENGLNPDEIHAMRRTVLTAAPEPRRRLLPALALAGAAAVAVLIAFLALKPRPAEAPMPRIAAAAVQPVMPIPLPLPQPPAPREARETRKTAHRRHRARALPEAASTLASLEPSAASGEDAGTRQIQFFTPGGTRIIWILKSGKASR